MNSMNWLREREIQARAAMPCEVKPRYRWDATLGLWVLRTTVYQMRGYWAAREPFRFLHVRCVR